MLSLVDLLVLKHNGEDPGFDVLENQFLKALHQDGGRATGQ